MRAHFDTREVKALEVSLRGQKAKKLPQMRKVVRDGAGALTVLWRQNARDTAGEHGKHYPRSIGYDLRDGGLTAVIGPDASKPQGGMSFEYGSRNQPPHLDGNRAADDVFRVWPREVAEVAELDL